MDFIFLLVALFVPWIAGWLWIVVIDRVTRAEAVSRCRQLGYGFFLGYAILHALALFLNYQLGSIEFVTVLVFMMVIVLVGAVLALKLPPPRNSISGKQDLIFTAKQEKLLLSLLVGWVILHLTFGAAENFFQPVYPWDAWSSWIYRAKAWFYNGYLVSIDDPGEWISGVGTGIYNAPGNHYPTFLPVVTMWAALALDRWSETLVSLPTLLCGVAVGLAIYGQCRECGMARWLSALAVYMVLSIPLVGAHLSLAGQADIWMLGFTGLGFVALLRGSMCANLHQLFLGLVMVGLGASVKLIGVVWLLAALLTLLFARYYAIAVLGLLTTLVLVSSIWFLGAGDWDEYVFAGFSLTDVLGYFQLSDKFTMLSSDLSDDYWTNFFEKGSWHLLWTLVAICALSLWLLPRGRVRSAIGAFYSALLITQLLLVQFTESGRWAEDWTAINRLPMPFVPPLIFTLIVVLQKYMLKEYKGNLCRSILIAPALGLVFTALGVLAYLSYTFPTTDADKFELTSRDVRIATAGGKPMGNVGLVEGYSNGLAILTSGPVKLDASGLQLLSLNTSGTNQRSSTFFWRTGNLPEDLHSIEIPGRGLHWVSVGQLPDWRGRITEVGLIFYADSNKPVYFDFLELSPGSLLQVCRKVIDEWLHYAIWSMKSLNWVPAGSETSIIPLPLIVAIWFTVSLALINLQLRHTNMVPVAIFLCAFFAWIVLDLRWSLNRWAQFTTTIEKYPFASAEYLELGGDAQIKGLVDSVRSQIEGMDRRTMIIAEQNDMKFQMLRAKYHALPARTYIDGWGVGKIPTPLPDYILLLKQPYTPPEQRSITASEYIERVRRPKDIELTRLLETPEGFLVKVERKAN